MSPIKNGFDIYAYLAGGFWNGCAFNHQLKVFLKYLRFFYAGYCRTSKIVEGPTATLVLITLTSFIYPMSIYLCAFTMGTGNNLLFI